ncbi:unnamed protein product [Blepharisma stoltei]|uniref:PPPDE domain-containing protein n=1 Tax=Blepharisma stoltei TaxID=1481888 RepID=A0AAU9IPQ8_9CILI|nr:unnamed protein product [Blepharisma stoltei]
MQVYLNVYHIAKLSKYTATVGMGIYHSTIEINNLEYSFGKGDEEGSGIYTIVAGTSNGLVLCERKLLGICDKTMYEIECILVELKKEFFSENYHLILRNCNHFAQAFAYSLLKTRVPRYINRLSDMTHCLTCILPPNIWNRFLDEKRPLLDNKSSCYS